MGARLRRTLCRGGLTGARSLPTRVEPVELSVAPADQITRRSTPDPFDVASLLRRSGSNRIGPKGRRREAVGDRPPKEISRDAFPSRAAAQQPAPLRGFPIALSMHTAGYRPPLDAWAPAGPSNDSPRHLAFGADFDLRFTGSQAEGAQPIRRDRARRHGKCHRDPVAADCSKGAANRCAIPMHDEREFFSHCDAICKPARDCINNALIGGSRQRGFERPSARGAA